MSLMTSRLHNIAMPEVRGHIAYLLSSSGRPNLESSAWLCEEARKAKVHLLAIYSLLNNKASINNIPTEILLQIFAHYIEVGSTNERWCVLIQVCRQWRQVAHSFPGLWTRFEQSVELQCPESDTRRPSDSMFHFVNSSEGWRGLEVAGLSAQAATLERVVLGRSFLEHAYMPSADQNSMATPLTLQFTRIRIPWNIAATRFVGLHTLHLSKKSAYEEAPSIDDILNLLDQNKNTLQIIDFAYGDFRPNRSGDFRRNVDLPMLRSLTYHRVELCNMKDSQHNLADVNSDSLIASLSIPKTARLSFKLVYLGLQPAEAAMRFCLPPDDLSRLHPLCHIEELKVEDLATHTRVLGFGARSSSTAEPALFELQLHTKNNAISWDLVQYTISRLSQHSLKTRTLWLGPIPFFWQWNTVLAFNGLQSLGVVNYSFTDLTSLFRALATGMQPQLRDLRIWDPIPPSKVVAAAAASRLKRRRKTCREASQLNVWLNGRPLEVNALNRGVQV